MLEGLENYDGREQSWVKHHVLRKYLERFARIIGSRWSSITFVDGFSGPWNVQAKSLADSSFSIALSELRKARKHFSLKGRQLKIRCVFVEKNASAYRELEVFGREANQENSTEILTLNTDFENAIPEIVRFIEADSETFPFIYIDPAGWTGFSMERIAPLLKLTPCEVLINFMLEFIRRFIEQEPSRDSFQQLFGDIDYDDGLKDLDGIDRDDAITERYCRALKEVCHFDFVHRANILHQDKDQSHFQLIYGTRHPKGVEKFKEVEKVAMKAQEESRARIEVARKDQLLFNPEVMPESQYYVNLRDRYITQAKQSVNETIRNSRAVSYDDLWAQALAFQMVWESDLKEWLTEWRRRGDIDWDGLQPREKTLKYGKGHSVSRRGINPPETSHG